MSTVACVRRQQVTETKTLRCTTVATDLLPESVESVRRWVMSCQHLLAATDAAAGWISVTVQLSSGACPTLLTITS